MSEIDIDISDPPERGLSLHHLPVQIKHTGLAKVNSFFRPTLSSAKYEGRPVMEAAFRGRRLRGVEVSLPTGYSGVIFKEADPTDSLASRFREEDESEGNQKGNKRVWSVQSLFGAFTMWTRHAEPSRQDKVLKWMEWASIAEKLHRPITEEQLAAPAKRARAPSVAKASSEEGTEAEAQTESAATKRKSPDEDGKMSDEDTDGQPPSKRRKVAEDGESGEPLSPTKKLQRRHSTPANRKK